jgi:hypothetical protein
MALATSSSPRFNGAGIFRAGGAPKKDGSVKRMNITMTWADGALALLLGVIGSIFASYLYNRLPIASEIVSQWWAQRSPHAAGKRLLKLQKQLQQIEAFKQDERRYVGWMIETLSHVEMRTAFALLFFIIATATLTISTIRPDARSELEFLTFFASGSAFGLLLLATSRRGQLIDHSDLEQREKDLQDEI